MQVAKDCLDKGIKIDDDLNDFVPMTGRDLNNPNPYSFPYLDMVSVEIGADENYLYVKYLSGGNFPKNEVKHKGDVIQRIGYKINMNKVNPVTGKLSTEMIETGDMVNFNYFLPLGHRFVKIRNREDYDAYENGRLKTYQSGRLMGGYRI